MHLFQSSQKCLAMMGIRSNQHRFNVKILASFVLFFTLSILYLMFILREANEFKEYIDPIYLGSSTTVIGLCFTNFVWKMVDVFQLVYKIETIVESREYFIKQICFKKTKLKENKLRYIFRANETNSNGDLRWNYSSSGKMEWNCLPCDGSSNANGLGIPEILRLHFHLFYYRIGFKKWCTWFTTSNVVSWMVHILNTNLFQIRFS